MREQVPQYTDEKYLSGSGQERGMAAPEIGKFRCDELHDEAQFHSGVAERQKKRAIESFQQEGGSWPLK